MFEGTDERRTTELRRETTHELMVDEVRYFELACRSLGSEAAHRAEFARGLGMSPQYLADRLRAVEQRRAVLAPGLREAMAQFAELHLGRLYSKKFFPWRETRLRERASVARTPSRG